MILEQVLIFDKPLKAKHVEVSTDIIFENSIKNVYKIKKSPHKGACFYSLY